METENCIVKKEHTSRIWDVSSNKSGDLVASASGDESIKVFWLPW